MLRTTKSEKIDVQKIEVEGAEWRRNEIHCCFAVAWDYWGKELQESLEHGNAQFIIRLNKLMSCNCFEAIAACLLPYCDSRRRKKCRQSTPERSCLFMSIWSRDVSVDERMVKNKARTKFRQYLRDQPIKRGFKNWVMSDPTGYMCDFNLYCHAAQSVRSENGLAYDVASHISHFTSNTICCTCWNLI